MSSNSLVYPPIFIKHISHVKCESANKYIIKHPTEITVVPKNKGKEGDGDERIEGTLGGVVQKVFTEEVKFV